MKLCFHKWHWHNVQYNGERHFQPGYCSKCGKGKVRWIK